MPTVTNSTAEKSNLKPTLEIPDGAKILFVCDDISEHERVKTLLFETGVPLECVGNLREACDVVKTGQYQVVISTPFLKDGSWSRLSEVATHHDLSYEIVLWAYNFDSSEWVQSLNAGAFDVVDAICERSKVVEVTKSALWSAYLRGAGPSPASRHSQKVA